MPQSYVESYSQIGGREDLINIITNISPEETVYMSRIGKTTATFRFHEWTTETLQASNSGNAIVEGATAAFASGDWTARTRLGNYTQILRKTFSASYTQEEIKVAGVVSEFDHQRELKTKELARDINSAMINQASASGTSAVARTMHGALAFITTNTASGGGTQLSQPMYNLLQQNIWVVGGHPNATYVGGFQKRLISNWTQPLNRNIDAEGKRLVVAVDVYDGDFGRQMILLEREMPAAQLMTIEEQYHSGAYLRPLFFEETAKVGGQRRGYVESEVTLEVRAENSGGLITGLATA